MSSRPFRSFLVVLVAIGGLTACNSTPSARRVALDVIDTLDVSDSVKACMRAKVEAYTKDEIADFAEGADEDPPDPESQAALDKFEDELADCNSTG
ncbi:MAG TPA: hypothetical protein VNO51_18090 [Ilumatobacteraceae bacterium]|nr:hypothetical protein [Ilumatobacteraceae bacterium]